MESNTDKSQSFTLLDWNPKGGKADERKKVTKKYFAEINPDIFTYQEVDGEDKNLEKYFELQTSTRNYKILRSGSPNEAAVIYDSNIFTAELISYVPYEKDVLDDKKKENINELFKNRTCFVKLTPKGDTSLVFYVVSYHGLHNEVDASLKAIYLREYLGFLKAFEEKHKAPVLLGGDFNFTLDSFDGATLHGFPTVGGKNKKNNIDYVAHFGSSLKRKIKFIQVNTHPIEELKDYESHGISNHQAIVAKFTFVDE